MERKTDKLPKNVLSQVAHSLVKQKLIKVRIHQFPRDSIVASEELQMFSLWSLALTWSMGCIYRLIYKLALEGVRFSFLKWMS